jgi:hypothetical protein
MGRMALREVLSGSKVEALTRSIERMEKNFIERALSFLLRY